MDAETSTFCLLLAHAGCRVSEALAVAPEHLDLETGRVIFRTLKRRKRVFRAVPVPPELMIALWHLAKGKRPATPLWSWCRQTAWRRVKAVMRAASITGAQAMPKGLRHGFGIANAEQNVPPALTQRWMGHARLETTAIYQHAIGEEERAFAERIWRRSGKRRH
jgi:integrase